MLFHQCKSTQYTNRGYHRPCDSILGKSLSRYLLSVCSPMGVSTDSCMGFVLLSCHWLCSVFMSSKKAAIVYSSLDCCGFYYQLVANFKPVSVTVVPVTSTSFTPTVAPNARIAVCSVAAVQPPPLASNIMLICPLVLFSTW